MLVKKMINNYRSDKKKQKQQKNIEMTKNYRSNKNSNDKTMSEMKKNINK